MLVVIYSITLRSQSIQSLYQQACKCSLHIHSNFKENTPDIQLEMVASERVAEFVLIVQRRGYKIDGIVIFNYNLEITLLTVKY